MKSSRKLFPYLVLNIVISAATTLLVLWLWDYYLYPQTFSADATTALSTPSLSTPYPSLPTAGGKTPAGEKAAAVEIENVYGVGDLETEKVVIKQVGEVKQSLTNWELRDRDGHVFKFPQLELNRNGSIQISTKIGVNSVIELYWGSDTAIWETGEEVRLFNEKGKLQTVYTIP